MVACSHWPACSACAQERADVIRVGAVNTPYYTGLLDALIGDFRKKGGQEVWIYSGKDVYDQARAGNVDLIISHYGKEGIEPFVLEGLGEWPRPVFANQAALIGPESDPAGVRGVDSVVEAFRRIAASGSPYVVNNSPAFCYFTEILWQAAGKPEKGDWFIVPRAENVTAVELAESKGGYIVYGAFPFLRYKAAAGLKMDALVLDDPLLQRMMVSVLVKPDRVPGVNYQGAQAFQQYLLSPRAQVLVRGYRVEGSVRQLWWPAGRHNNPEVLAAEDASWNTSTRQSGAGTGGGAGGRGDGTGGGRGTGSGGGTGGGAEVGRRR
jgi:tungstate transport system substrate-binding protein